MSVGRDGSRDALLLPLPSGEAAVEVHLRVQALREQESRRLTQTLKMPTVSSPLGRCRNTAEPQTLAGTTECHLFC